MHCDQRTPGISDIIASFTRTGIYNPDYIVATEKNARPSFYVVLVDGMLE